MVPCPEPASAPPPHAVTARICQRLGASLHSFGASHVSPVGSLHSFIYYHYYLLFGTGVHQKEGVSASPGPAEKRPRWYRGTSLIRNRRPLGPYSRTMPRALWGS